MSEKIEYILKEIVQARSIKFSALFANATSRTEVVVTFLAMLELIRLKQLVAVQESAFGEINLTSAPPAVEGAINPAEAYAAAVTQDAASAGSAQPVVTSPQLN